MASLLSWPPLKQLLGVSSESLGFSVARREEVASGGTALIRRRFYSNGHREVEKILHPRFQGVLEYEKLQSREYTILSDLKHPGVVRVLRLELKPLGRSHHTAVLIFEDRQAVSLDALRVFLSQVSFADKELFCWELLSAVSETLRFVHGRGIVHADLSPENILIDPFGFVHLIDFACSTREGVEPHGFLVRGKMFYRDPDESETGRITSRSDCFALGRIIELLMGEDLHQSERLSREVKRLISDRTLPFYYGAQSMRVSVLPGRQAFMSQNRVVEKTPIKPVARLVSHKTLWRNVACLLCGLLMTSWMPQWGKLTFNSWPKTLVSIDASNWRTSHETPVTNMSLPAGRHRVRIKCPQNSCGSHEREILILPGDTLKVFEDFHKN